MIIARVKLFGSVHDVVDKTVDEIELPDGASVQDLISAMISRYGEGFARRMLTPSGRLQMYTQIFVDGREVDYVRLDSPLVADGRLSTDVEMFVVQQFIGG